MYKTIIDEICHELNIECTYLSKDWLIKLKKDNKIKYVAGNKFPLNNYVVGRIMDDKYALYEILNNLSIPVCLHHIFFNEFNTKDYCKGCQRKEDLINTFNEYGKNVIIKPNKGSQGKGVIHIKDEITLLKEAKELLTTNYSISMQPFYKIKNEYRTIILDNEVKLLFKKINPTVIGNGKSTLKELLIDFNKEYFSDKEIPNIIPKDGEEYIYDFHFNLSNGSIASTDIKPSLKEKIISLALEVTKKVGIRFASVDIIETVDNELFVLEANSGVTIDKAINYLNDGYNIAKNIYKEAIIKMFTE